MLLIRLVHQDEGQPFFDRDGQLAETILAFEICFEGQARVKHKEDCEFAQGGSLGYI